MTQPKDALGRFGLAGEEPLAKKTMGIRLRQSDYDKLMAIHPNDYTDWIREVIRLALSKEG